MEVRFACVPAPDVASNEDHVVATPGLVAVFDGVTVPAGLDTGCVHGTTWYVHNLGAQLVAAYAAASEAPLSDLLAAAIDAVRALHQGTCDLDHPGTPQATVSLLRTANGTADYLVLCDSPLVYEAGDTIEVVTDLRLKATSRKLRELALAGGSPIGAAGHDQRVRALVESQRQYVNQPHGYWIAAATTEAAYNAVTGTIPLHGPERLTRAAVLTDGASRAVDTFGLTDWRGMLDLLDQHGPRELISQVRAAELADTDGIQRPRYKRHDDAAVAYCRFTEEPHR